MSISHTARSGLPLLIGLGILLVLPGNQPVTGSGGEQGDVKGVTYEHYRIREVPWSINVIRIDRSQTNLELTTTFGRGSAIGLSPLTSQLRAIPPDFGQPVAAVNGDFYRLEHDLYAGDPRGLQIVRGELVSGPIDRDCFWLDRDRVPHIGEVESNFKVTWADGTKTPIGLNEERVGNRAVLYTPAAGLSTGTYGGTEYILERAPNSPWLPLSPGQNYKARIREIRPTGQTRLKPDIAVLSVGNYSRVPAGAIGDIIEISTATKPDLKGATMAIGGGPSLVHEGKAHPGYVLKAMERHPRSAFGWNKKEFLFVEVDGRQPGFSMGMTLPEMAAYLVKLGCEEGIGLDGGGSAELWLQGRIMNSPCFGRERSTANTLVVVARKGTEKQ